MLDPSSSTASLRLFRLSVTFVTLLLFSALAPLSFAMDECNVISTEAYSNWMTPSIWDCPAFPNRADVNVRFDSCPDAAKHRQVSFFGPRPAVPINSLSLSGCADALNTLLIEDAQIIIEGSQGVLWDSEFGVLHLRYGAELHLAHPSAPLSAPNGGTVVLEGASLVGPSPGGTQVRWGGDSVSSHIAITSEQLPSTLALMDITLGASSAMYMTGPTALQSSRLVVQDSSTWSIHSAQVTLHKSHLQTLIGESHDPLVEILGPSSSIIFTDKDDRVAFSSGGVRIGNGFTLACNVSGTVPYKACTTTFNSGTSTTLSGELALDGDSKLAFYGPVTATSSLDISIPPNGFMSIAGEKAFFDMSEGGIIDVQGGFLLSSDAKLKAKGELSGGISVNSATLEVVGTLSDSTASTWSFKGTSTLVLGIGTSGELYSIQASDAQLEIGSEITILVRLNRSQLKGDPVFEADLAVFSSITGFDQATIAFEGRGHNDSPFCAPKLAHTASTNALRLTLPAAIGACAPSSGDATTVLYTAGVFSLAALLAISTGFTRRSSTLARTAALESVPKSSFQNAVSSPDSSPSRKGPTGSYSGYHTGHYEGHYTEFSGTRRLGSLSEKLNSGPNRYSTPLVDAFDAGIIHAEALGEQGRISAPVEVRDPSATRANRREPRRKTSIEELWTIVEPTRGGGSKSRTPLGGARSEWRLNGKSVVVGKPVCPSADIPRVPGLVTLDPAVVSINPAPHLGCKTAHSSKPRGRSRSRTRGRRRATDVGAPPPAIPPRRGSAPAVTIDNRPAPVVPPHTEALHTPVLPFDKAQASAPVPARKGSVSPIVPAPKGRASPSVSARSAQSASGTSRAKPVRAPRQPRKSRGPRKAGSASRPGRKVKTARA